MFWWNCTACGSRWERVAEAELPRSRSAADRAEDKTAGKSRLQPKMQPPAKAPSTAQAEVVPIYPDSEDEAMGVGVPAGKRGRRGS